MVKRVSSKVIKTAPLIERRVCVSIDPGGNWRRASDIPPVNVRDGRAINSSAYTVFSGRVRASKCFGRTALILDRYA